MRRIVQMLCVLGVLAGMGQSAAASAGDKPMIAILPLQASEGTGLSPEDVSYLTDIARGTAAKVLGDGYIVQTEQNMQRILSGLGMTLEQCMAQAGDCEVEVARKLQADYAVAGRVRKALGELKLTIQLYQTENGDLLDQRDKDVSQIGDLKDAMRSSMIGLLSGLPGAAGAGPSAGLPAMPMEMRDASGSDWQPSGSAAVKVVKFNSAPQGAMVMVDGKPVCTKTPCSKALSEGMHQVAMHLERYVSREELVDTANQKKFRWKLEEDFARLNVETDPPGIEVRVDGQPAGKSPLSGLELAPGAHVIEAGGDRCHQRHKKQITLSRGESVNETLEPMMIPASILVEAVDGDDNDLEGRVRVDGEEVGGTLEAIRVSVCAKTVQVETDDGATATASLALKARTEETLRLVLSGTSSRVSTERDGGTEAEPEADVAVEPEPRPDVGPDSGPKGFGWAKGAEQTTWIFGGVMRTSGLPDGSGSESLDRLSEGSVSTNSAAIEALSLGGFAEAAWIMDQGMHTGGIRLGATVEVMYAIDMRVTADPGFGYVRGIVTGNMGYLLEDIGSGEMLIDARLGLDYATDKCTQIGPDYINWDGFSDPKDQCDISDSEMGGIFLLRLGYDFGGFGTALELGGSSLYGFEFGLTLFGVSG